MIGAIVHVMLFSKDLEPTVKWYTDVLGFEVGYHAPGEFASLRHDSMGRLTLHGGADAADVGHGAYPYYGVGDLDATVAWLRDRGVWVEEIQEGGARHTWFKDCEGNFIGLEEVG